MAEKQIIELFKRDLESVLLQIACRISLKKIDIGFGKRLFLKTKYFTYFQNIIAFLMRPNYRFRGASQNLNIEKVEKSFLLICK